MNGNNKRILNRTEQICAVTSEDCTFAQMERKSYQKPTISLWLSLSQLVSKLDHVNELSDCTWRLFWFHYIHEQHLIFRLESSSVGNKNLVDCNLVQQTIVSTSVRLVQGSFILPSSEQNTIVAQWRTQGDKRSLTRWYEYQINI